MSHILPIINNFSKRWHLPPLSLRSEARLFRQELDKTIIA